MFSTTRKGMCTNGVLEASMDVVKRRTYSLIKEDK